MTYGTGIHAHVDIDLYHSQACCPGTSISSTGLRSIIAQCPAIYWAHSDLNANRVTDETPSLSLGRAAHALVLGEPQFNAKFVISKFDDFRSREAKAWRDMQDRQIVKPADMEIIHAMVDAQRRSPQCAHAFINGEPEMSIFWQDKESGIWCKSRPDWLANDIEKEFCIEYKTAANIAPRELSFDAFKYGYHMQASMLLDGLEIVTGKKPLGIAHVVQMKEAPYLAELRVFSKEQIAFGRMQYKHALHIFTRCLAAHEWPGYTTQAAYFETPWYVKKFMENPNDYATRYGDDFEPADYLAAG
jgi:hypothetical protein